MRVFPQKPVKARGNLGRRANIAGDVGAKKGGSGTSRPETAQFQPKAI